jgi:hypothetical protein
MLIALLVLVLAWGSAEASIGSGTSVASPALTGCAGYWFTLPSDCAARYLLDYLTTQPASVTPEGTGPPVPYATDPEWRVYRYWSRPSAISCECFEERDPPPGQVWMRVTP